MASSKIRWNGTTEDDRTTSVIWGNNSYTWGDLALAEELAGAGGSTPDSRIRKVDTLLKKDPEKKKRLIRLICRVKGEKVYDETKEAIGDIDIKIEDVDMVVNEILGKIKVETKDVL